MKRQSGIRRGFLWCLRPGDRGSRAEGLRGDQERRNRTRQGDGELPHHDGREARLSCGGVLKPSRSLYSALRRARQSRTPIDCAVRTASCLRLTPVLRWMFLRRKRTPGWGDAEAVGDLLVPPALPDLGQYLQLAWGEDRSVGSVAPTVQVCQHRLCSIAQVRVEFRAEKALQHDPADLARGAPKAARSPPCGPNAETRPAAPAPDPAAPPARRRPSTGPAPAASCGRRPCSEAVVHSLLASSSSAANSPCATSSHTRAQAIDSIVRHGWSSRSRSSETSSGNPWSRHVRAA